MDEQRNKEDKLSKKVSSILGTELKNYKKLKVESQKHVFIKCKIGIKKDILKLLFQSAKQDICIFLENYSNSLFPTNSFFQRFTNSFPKKQFILPLVIFEFKFEKVNTHQIRQYNDEARMIKQIFPFCMYNLVLINYKRKKLKKTDKIYMAGSNFDRVCTIDSKNPRTISKVLHKVVKNHLKYLKGEEFLLVNNFIK